jgi:hypothetical protein
MRQTLQALGDRLVSLVVPRSTAAACACFPGTSWRVQCYCSGWHLWVKTCQYNCYCKVTCSSCYDTGVNQICG